MKKRWLLLYAIITVIVVVAAISFYAALSGSSPASAQAGPSDESVTQTGFPSFTVDEATPVPVEGGPQSPDALPTPIPGDNLVYFVPSDNDATATEIYLYNSSEVTQTVLMRGYSYNGVLVYSLNINVKAESFLRLASDSIAAAPPPSWATPAPIITNFTDFTYYASLELPPGVRAEGNTLFNPGTGVVDPRASQGAIPLTFNSDATATPTPTTTPTPMPTAPKSSPTAIRLALPQVVKQP
jgi:hypothetical protein